MFLARDDGPGALADHQAYVFMSGERDPDNDTVEVRAFARIFMASKTWSAW